MSFLDDLNAGMNSIADSLFGRKGQRQPQYGQPSWQGGPQGWQGQPQGWQNQPMPQGWPGGQQPQPMPQNWQGGQQPQPMPQQPQNWGQPMPQGWQRQQSAPQPWPQTGGHGGQPCPSCPPSPQGWQGQAPMQQGSPAGQDSMNFGIGALAGAALGAGMGGKGMAGAAKGVVLAGAGYAAWQFFKKWSANRQAQQNAPGQGWQQPAPLPGPDPQALLAVRAIVYAARADGSVDAEEQARITAAVQQFFPGQDAGQLVQALLQEPIDVRAVAAGVGSMEQAEDVYAMSCMATAIDHPGERAYMNDLAAALYIPPERRDAIERNAAETRARMSAQMQAPAAAAAPAPAPDPVQAQAAAPAESVQQPAPKQEPAEQAPGTGTSA